MDRRSFAMLLIFVWLLGSSMFDIRYRKVPVWTIIVGGVAAAGVGICKCLWGENNPADLLAGMIPGAILLLVALGTRKAGWADGIILAILGSVLGFGQCMLTTMLSLILISVLSATLLLLKKADKGTAIPYVPFLTAGFALCRIIGG
ncbi:MAG: prepilin peptidase [Eubacterium sp.]|nr:prepilin peptidase [Eubacterium sp.]MCM1214511.1 prepilin peptidase [Lachnospiraceae bacterium]MCM1303556.1 prepilin peptidase [Butyrivibrio sp.]MCM1343280.1 prepilin peptidase [Muribaculaceae bacterium]MCM1238390.1 prepilin peptidase [Lachnospiraceae bacterium]